VVSEHKFGVHDVLNTLELVIGIFDDNFVAFGLDEVVLYDSFVKFRAQTLPFIVWIDENLRYLGPKLVCVLVSLVRRHEASNMASLRIIQQEVLPKSIGFNLRSSVDEKGQNALKIKLFLLEFIRVYRHFPDFILFIT